MFRISNKWKALVAGAIFGLCIGPTFISYRPYTYRWDDSDYLQRAITASRAFWSADLRGLKDAMGGIRPPAMTLLGFPWGPLRGWDAAGKCFITLATVISLLAAACLYLLLRIGVSPFLLVSASLCALASTILPYPPHPPDPLALFAERASLQSAATAFLADNLFAWTGLAAALLIPYEARTVSSSSVRAAILRGLLWASILSLGMMTKLNFLYFVLTIVPVLVLTRLRRAGLRNALAAFVTFACCSAPAAFYLIRWGRPAFDNAKQNSFGGVADLYYISLVPYLSDILRDSPGVVLSFALTLAALLYVVIKRRTVVRVADLLALLIMIGFGVLVFATPNRQIRYAFPAIIGLPFLTTVLICRARQEAPPRFAALIAGLVFCGLLAAAMPMRTRADRQTTLSRSNAVLAQATACDAKRIVLATDSPTLSEDLLGLAVAVSAPAVSAQAPHITNLAYSAMSGVPLEKDFQAISGADQVVFQDRAALNPPFSNQRVAQYEQYVRQSGYAPIRVGDDLTVYSMRCTINSVAKK